MAEVKMVTVNGVRYRPEDAPKRDRQDDEGQAEHKMRKPANKSAKATK